MEKILISIISSERTWNNFSKFGFDEKLIKERKRFELALVLNGYNKEAIEYFNKFQPDYFFLRQNLGYDPAAVEHLLKLIPVFDTTLILHDDHWFRDGSWLDKILTLRSGEPEIDVWGNIVYNLSNEFPGFSDYCKANGHKHLIDINSGEILQGLSGIFSAKAITELKKIQFNFPLVNDKHLGEIGERIFSNSIIHLNLKLRLFPEGIFAFLCHNRTNDQDHFFWTASSLAAANKYLEARDYYFKYLNFCNANGVQGNNIGAFYNIALASFMLQDFSTAVDYCKKCLSIESNFPAVINLLTQIKEKIDV